MSSDSEQNGSAQGYSRRRILSYDGTLAVVRDLSENATLRPSPFCLAFVEAGDRGETDPDETITASDTES